MARYKISRARFAFDATAMCDIAFLILTFFILTGRPKSYFSERVKLPFTKHFNISDPDGSTNFYIAIGNGKCSFGVEGYEIRKEALIRMAKQYKVAFTQNEINKFAHVDGFNCSIYRLKDYINNYKYTDLMEIGEGVPVDETSNNELYNWVNTCRLVTRDLEQTEARAIIYGDEKESFTNIKVLIDNLQRQQMNKFLLLTNMNVSPRRFN